MPKRLLIWLALVAACGQPRADVVQIWFDPDYGPPTMEAIEHGAVGTLWLVVRVGGVAYVCEVLDSGWEGLVEIAFNDKMIGYPPNPKVRKRKCDNHWSVKGLTGDVSEYDLPRLRIEAETCEQETSRAWGLETSNGRTRKGAACTGRWDVRLTGA